MAKLKFLVRSSSGKGIYELEAYRTPKGIRFSCTCEAAENGTHCKHRLNLLWGDPTDLESDNLADVSALTILVDGSLLAASVIELTALEAEAEAARLKKEIGSMKKTIAKLMMG